MHYRGLFIGLTTIDIQYFVDDFPEQNKKVKTQAPDILVGGPATNAAVAFSYLNKQSNLATVVAKNSFTSFVENDFYDTNITLFDFAKTQHLNPIVASVITSENGERNIFTHNPTEIVPDITAEELFKKVQPQIVLCDGFYPEFSIECLQLAKAKNTTVVIDAGSWKTQYLEIMKYTDVAICSADFYPPGCTNSSEVFHYLQDKGIDKIAISRGGQSILFQDGAKKGEVNVPKSKVVDTLGAGDFLHGAFAYYYLESGCFNDALLKASKLASASCAYKGTREWLKY